VTIGFRARVSVRDLVAFAWRRGDLGSDAGPVLPASDGVIAHRRLQRGRGPGFRAEAPMSLTVRRRGVELQISGRADGLLQDADPPAIEEIKTVASPLMLLPSDGLAIHWAQADMYAAMYARDLDLAAVEARLAYVHFGTGQVRTLRRVRSRAWLEAFLEETVEAYLLWLSIVAAHRSSRGASLRDLRFPYPAFRPGQRILADSVRRSAARGERLFVQAPTGCGKTMGVLFGALEALAADPSLQIFFLTSRDTGKRAALAAFDDIAAAGVSVKVLALTSRERVCPHPDAGCSASECPLARGHFDRVRAAAARLFEERVATREVVTAIASEHGVCPYELACELLPWTDAVVCDLSYVFDPRVGQRVARSLTTQRRVYLVDEAHNLVDRSREMFSAGVSLSAVRAARAEASGEAAPLAGPADAISAGIRAASAVALEDGARNGVLREPPEALLDAIDGYCDAAGTLMSERPAVRHLRGTRSLFFEAFAFARFARGDREGHAVLVSSGGADRRVEMFCVDPSHELARATGPDAAAIFFSATLSPMGYFTRLLARGGAPTTLVQPSSFPAENLCVAVADRVPATYRDRGASLSRVAELAAEVVRARAGNYMIYLPSYDYLAAVREAFEAIVAGVRVLAQSPGMTDAERERFLRAFAPAPTSTTVGLAVLGGIFAEGIDLAGDRLTGAVVVTVGLPGVDPRRELVRGHFDEQGAEGFRFAYAYPGMSRVLQAAGRVIRSAEDRGVVLLIDRRFGAPPYRDLLSGWPRRSSVRSAADLRALLSAFWAEKKVEADAARS